MSSKGDSIPSARHTRVRSRLLVPFVISNLLMITMALSTISYFEKLNEQDFHANKKANIINTYENVIAENVELQSALIQMIQTNRDIRQAWLNNDLLELLQITDPLFEYIRDQHSITHFYFHKPDKTVYLRLHNKDKWGDENRRMTMRKASESGQAASGLEFGQKGRFVLRTVVPWWVDGKLIGYVEMGEEMDQLLQRVSKIGSVELAMILDKEMQDAIAARSGMALKSEYNLSQENDSYIILYSTYQVLSQALYQLYETVQDLNQPDFKKFINQEQSFISASFPVLTADGQQSAYLVFSNDISQFVATEDALLKVIASIIIAVAITLVIFYYFYSGRLQNYLSNIYNKLAVEIDARMDSEKQLEAYSRQLEDEVRERTRELQETNEELEKDIELRKQTEEDFRRSEERYRSLFEKTPAATLILDGHKFVDCNDATVKMLRYNSKEELLMTHPAELSPTKQADGRDSREKAEEIMQLAHKLGSYSFEWDHKRADGEVFPVEVVLTSIPMGDHRVLYTVWRDISDTKKHEETIRQQAFYDSLTGLPNRVLLRDRLQQAIIHANRFQNHGAVFFMDLDQFKKINDSLGHSIGDALLIEAANRIQGCLREGDTAARLGGDEFVVLLPDLPNDENSYNYAEKVAEKIKTVINEPYSIEQYELKISTSIGISLFAGKNENIDDILRHADTAMYRAKDDGRNAIRFFLPSMQAEVLKRLTLEKDLAEAFEAEALELNYQPQYTDHHELFGVEALLRWQHPKRGYISPLEFIPVAEDIGLIIPISTWVLTKAMQDMCELMARRQKQVPIRLSINLSPTQFMQDDFILSIKQALGDTGFPARLLTLEITENVIINNIDDTIAKCFQLKELGIHIALDDFGTGYSSLSYLKRLPINELKIDRSFIRDIETDKNDAILVESIISMAHHFNLEIVAEGVETLEQLNFLMKHNCDAYQGFYFSKPLNIDSLTELYLNAVAGSKMA